VLFKRRSVDPQLAQALELFRPVAHAVDRAQRALLVAVPTYRNPGAPLRAALDAFEAELSAVEALMPPWRTSFSDEAWTRCAEALKQTRSELLRLRDDPPGPEEFEKLNARLSDVLSPLEEFAETERRLRGKPV
jgi:hypothetical protein